LPARAASRNAAQHRQLVIDRRVSCDAAFVSLLLAISLIGGDPVGREIDSSAVGTEEFLEMENCVLHAIETAACIRAIIIHEHLGEIRERGLFELGADGPTGLLRLCDA
jgi:hypothetical protein